MQGSGQVFHVHDATKGSPLPQQTPYLDSANGMCNRSFGDWTREEDAALMALVEAEGPGDWTAKAVALGPTVGFRSSTAIRKRYNRLACIQGPSKATCGRDELAMPNVTPSQIAAAAASTAFRFRGGNGPVANVGAVGDAMGRVLSATPLGSVGSVQGVGLVPPAAPMGCLAPVGSVGPKPDMLSALVQQAAAEEDALVGQASADEPLKSREHPPKSASRMVACNGKVVASYTDEDDKALQRVVSMFGPEQPAGVSVWDKRVEAFNAMRQCARSKGALRQRWSVLRSQGWKALPEATGQKESASSPWNAEDDECLRQMVVAPHGLARKDADSQVGSSDSKQASKAHQKLRREMSAINSDVAVLRDRPVDRNGSDFLQEHIVSQLAQLMQAVENVDRLWFLVQKEGGCGAQIKLVKETCVELTATAKSLRSSIAAAFAPQTVSANSAEQGDTTANTSRPKKKFKQIRNANQHAQAGIARKVLNAWLDLEDRPPKDRYSFVGRSDEQKTEMVRLVNAALIEQGLLPAYTKSNLVNWFKNLAYKQALKSQGRLPPSWVRSNRDTESRYLSGPLTSKTSAAEQERDAHLYNIERLKALAETQEQTMAHAIGQDKFTASHLAGGQKTQYHQYAEHANAVLKHYVNSENPQLPDPYSATARTDAICDQMVAQVNAAFVANGLEPLYKRKNLTNWFNNMSNMVCMDDHSTCDGQTVKEAAGDPKATRLHESIDRNQPSSKRKCSEISAQGKRSTWINDEPSDDEELLACYQATSGSDSFWLTEEDEMQRGVDFHLFPSLRVEKREPVTPVDNVTREALLSKYPSLGPPSLPPGQKASLLLKYESMKFVEASPSGATRT